jgi:hypothetical protein
LRYHVPGIFPMKYEREKNEERTNKEELAVLSPPRTILNSITLHLRITTTVILNSAMHPSVIIPKSVMLLETSGFPPHFL